MSLRKTGQAPVQLLLHVTENFTNSWKPFKQHFDFVTLKVYFKWIQILNHCSWTWTNVSRYYSKLLSMVVTMEILEPAFFRSGHFSRLLFQLPLLCHPSWFPHHWYWQCRRLPAFVSAFSKFIRRWGWRKEEERKRKKIVIVEEERKEAREGGREGGERCFGSWTLFRLNEVKTLRYTLNLKCSCSRSQLTVCSRVAV